MKAKILTSFIILTVFNTLVHGCTTNNSTGSNKQTVKQNTSNQNVQFVCDRSYDQASSQYVYSTLAWNEKSKKPIIVWKQEDFSGNGYPPKVRCEEVSPRFQEAYEQGSFKYMTHGEMNGQPVVCTASKVGNDCDTLLITLKQQDNAEKTLTQLSDTLLGYASGPLQQSSGDITYDQENRPYVEVNIEDFLNKS
jgi:Circadian oscillating protein COP23